MLLDSHNELAFAADGPLPFEQHDHFILAAELYAIAQALQSAVLPTRIYTDCKLVFDGINNGKHWCTDSSRKHRDIWHRVWFNIEELGGLHPRQLVFEKVKAHATLAERAELDERMFLGNQLADKFAKAGVALNTWQPWHESLYIDKYSQLISILEFACKTAVLSASLIDTTQRVKTKTSDTVCVYELFVEPPYAVEEGPTVDAPTTAHPEVDVASIRVRASPLRVTSGKCLLENVLSCPVLSCPVLCFVLCLVLSPIRCPVLSCPVSCLVLYPVLCPHLCPIVSCSVARM